MHNGRLKSDRSEEINKQSKEWSRE